MGTVKILSVRNSVVDHTVQIFANTSTCVRPLVCRSLTFLLSGQWVIRRRATHFVFTNWLFYSLNANLLYLILNDSSFAFHVPTPVPSHESDTLTPFPSYIHVGLHSPECLRRTRSMPRQKPGGSPALKDASDLSPPWARTFVDRAPGSGSRLMVISGHLGRAG